MEQFSILGGSQRPNGIGKSLYVYDGRYRVVIDSGSDRVSRDVIRIGSFEKLRDGRPIDAVILTHAHHDHIDLAALLAPYLAPHAKVYASPQTHEMLGPACEMRMQRDPGILSVSDVLTIRDPKRRVDIPVGESEILDGLFVNAIPNGHVPGSFALEIMLESGVAALITSDWCPQDQPVVKGMHLLSKSVPPKWWPRYVLGTDCTYGEGKRKPWADELRRLELAIRKCAARGGISVVCAFQFGRGQNIALDLAKIPGLPPIYADGGIRDIFYLFAKNPWSPHDVADFDMKNIRMVKSPEHRKELVNSTTPFVVVTTAGMADGGPVGTYLERALPIEDSGVFFTSYLAHDSVGEEIIQAKRNGGVVNIAVGPELNEFGNQANISSLMVRCDVQKFSFSAHGDLLDSERFFADIVEARGEKFEILVPAHGTPRGKNLAAAALAKFVKKSEGVIIGNENTVINL